MTLTVADGVALSPTTTLSVAGIGELVSSRDPSGTLVCYGLGSCVAVSAWDPRTHAAALAHFMLPTGSGGGPPVKFVDQGFERFLDAFRKLGGSPMRAEVKAVGGASMLTVMAGSLDIGRRNVQAVEAHLAMSGLRLAASDLGGSVGRTVQLAVGSGRLLIKSVAGTRTL
jgi:chemotaxis protein CheD